MRAEEPKAETVVPGQTREEKSNGQSVEELQARYQELKRQQQEGGTSTKSETAQPTDKTTQPESQVKSPELIQREQELTQALPKRQQVPVEIDPNLQGNAVRVHYSVDKKGQITDIQIKAGAQATPKDIALHASTVKRMQQYSGMSRHVQRLKDQWVAWRNDHGVPPVGSKAWEAQLEISKLPDIIQERVERLSNADLDPKSQQRLEAEIADLKGQLAEHQKTFKAMEKDPGKGFVAAEGLDETVDRLSAGFAKVIKSKGHQVKYQKDKIDYLKNKLDSGTIIEEIGTSRVVEHYAGQSRNIWKNVHLQAKGKDGKNIGGQQSEIDFLVFSPDGSLPPEIVSAKMNGQQVRPSTDLGNLSNFYEINLLGGNSFLQQDLRGRFKSPAYENTETIVVKYTDAKTGEIEEISLSEFRGKIPEPISLTNPERYDVKVLGMAPDDTLKLGAQSIKLGIDQKPLIDKVTENIDTELGGR
jgi:hypothetical protein